MAKRKYSYATKKKGKYGFKKRRITRRITARKGTKLSRIGSLNVHHFKRWVSTPLDLAIKPVLEDGTAQTITDTQTSNSGVLSFQLNDLVNPGEFTSLYDRYKITRILLKLHLVTNPDATLAMGSDSSSVLWNANPCFPRMWFCTDTNDTVGEAIEVFKQRATAKSIILKPNKDYKFWLKPCTLVQAYESAVTTAYEPSWNKWVNISDPTCKYYGWRYAFDVDGATFRSTYPYRVRINMCYYFTMKDVK